MKWIKVDEQLPPFNRKVLAFDTQRSYIAHCPEQEEYNEHWVVCEDGDCGCNGCTGAITHWMSLPDDPSD